MKQILLSVSLLFLTVAAQANPVFETYIQWIVDHSDLEYNGEPLPIITVVTHEQIMLLYYEEEAIEKARNGEIELPNILGLYDEVNNQLIFPNTVDLNNWNYHHIIVHELVHYLQDINGHFLLPEFINCKSGLEKLAYDLHIQWMDEVNHPAPYPDPLMLALIVNLCNDF